ncbi:sulfatase-like hydrolase/transferase [Tamlana sp. 2201CG12-4]|uniref:sulfatase-like hydrolase/transferase n=1 Tax=Tamlana sp. 2201CG12-4 TaxID=3112582 RepID=UPI002DBC2CD5|nr:sulfatase-like hydrolase/transferase [Tamlana sp. 2201CG12-4]MEC3907206.1 sulfatase-like hydrolase/transferase [Tamlana sp. 2201CG12-4]
MRTIKPFIYSLFVIFFLLESCKTKEKPLAVDNTSKSKPNIIIIYADDMGYGDLNALNKDSKIPTPNLDKLADEGMRFTDAHSASTVCSPSRYSLLTGRYHWRGHLKKGIVRAWGDPAIEKGRLTIASMLKESGYKTAAIGKWHLGMTYPFKEGIGQNDPKKSGWSDGNNVVYNPEDFDWEKPVEGGPNAFGFDYYYGDGTINFPPYVWMENNMFLNTPTALLDNGKTSTAEGSWECRPGPAVENWDIPNVPIKLTEKAVEWIGNQETDDKPFFMYFSMPSPHAPIVPAKRFQGTSKAGGYGDYMVQTDWMVGEVLNAIKEKGIEENTLVVFTSDNGPELYAYNRIKNYEHYSMGSRRGVKRDLWEGGHRVPFIVKYPGKVEKKSVNSNLISQIDIMATLANIVDYKLPENAGEDSKDFSKGIFSSEMPANREALVYHAVNGKFAVRKGNWVLIENKTGSVTKEPKWIKEKNNSKQDNTLKVLYNIEEDPFEQNNLYNDNTEKVKELEQLLNDIRGRAKNVNNDN